MADSSIVYHRSDVLRALHHLPTADDDYNSQTGAYDVLGRDHHMLGGDYDSEFWESDTPSVRESTDLYREWASSKIGAS